MREEIIKTVASWAMDAKNRYNEPVRKGTPKGDPIGFTSKKYQAALLMVLYPQCLQLNEIAKLAGVSEGVLRVWRTQNAFKRSVEDATKILGETLAEEMRTAIVEKSEEVLRNLEKSAVRSAKLPWMLKLGPKQIEALNEDIGKQRNVPRRVTTLSDDEVREGFPYPKNINDSTKKAFWVIGMIEFLNPLVGNPVDKMIMENREVSPGFATLLYEGIQKGANETFMWMAFRRPDILSAWKNILSKEIDLLADGRNDKVGDGELRKWAGEVKKIVSCTVDCLKK
jgi:hypothetical protein